MHSDQTDSTSVSITDEELALLGAPWAKEGMLCRKQYWESTGKRAKSKNWMNVFVVIQKGELSMFTFGGEGGGGATMGVGGGNWLVCDPSDVRPLTNEILTITMNTVQCTARWYRLSYSFTCACSAFSGLQPAAALLFRSHL